MIGKRLRLIALIAICLLGQIFPVFDYIKHQSEWITAFNISPHHTVFAYYPFFSDIRVYLKFKDKVIQTNSVDLYNATNIYSGKYIYSLFYMSYIYKKREISKRVLTWYFCNNKNYSTHFKFNEPLEAMRIDYVHRGTQEIVLTKKYDCTSDSR